MQLQSSAETPGMARQVQDAISDSQNDLARCDWFIDQGLGLFIHWNMDVQLGSVISHSMVGASQDYLDRYINELPKTFYPHRFDADEWARVSKVAGMKYVVFTTKHHSGFCMWDTKTTDFNIMNTPFGRDVVRELVDAYRKWGIQIGFYFSPDDFWILNRQGHNISRARPEASPLNNDELMAHNKAQVTELLTNYGPIDMVFYDGEAEGLRQLTWELSPQTLVTRGAMATPEQQIPDSPMPGPWEACFTLGTQWSYKPTHETYKTGTKLIEMLIETRAKGGNLLLNVGPKADGELPIQQTDRMQELALWLFANHEAIYDIRPWPVIRESLTLDHDIWYTQAKNGDTVFAFVVGTPWPKGERKVITLTEVRATEETQVEILGQSGNVLEYKPTVNPKAYWSQDEAGLHISAMRAQRLHNDNRWPNPVVIRITNARRP
ncbi:MAG: alpha-L-fucosidase [Chloroflexota bacterium]